MINLLLGAPGAGKSYESVVYHVIPAVQSNRLVITNLPLSLVEFENKYPGSTKYINLISDEKSIRAFSKIEHFQSDWRDPETNVGPLYVIDECQRVFPRSSVDSKIIEWFELHRHCGADVLLITQSYGKIHRTIIELLQIVWRCRKNVAFGSPKTYLRKTLDGVRGAEVSTKIRKYNPEFFGLYKSHTAGQAVDEASANQVNSIFRHWTFIGSAVLIAISIVLALTGFLNPFSTVNQNKDISPQSERLDFSIPKIQNENIKENVPVVTHETVNTEVNDKEKIHPFNKMKLHVVGSIYNDKKEISLFSASQNGQHVFNITNKELTDAGYLLTKKTDCAYYIEFENDYSEWLICDSPSVGVSTLPSI